MTQQDKVIAYIRANGTITSYEAFREFGICNLQSCIYELKKKGYKIIAVPFSSDEKKEGKGRYQNVYSLANDDNKKDYDLTETIEKMIEYGVEI